MCVYAFVQRSVCDCVTCVYVWWLRGCRMARRNLPAYQSLVATIRHSAMHTLVICNLSISIIVGPLQRVRPRNGILALLVLPLRSEFIGEL